MAEEIQTASLDQVEGEEEEETKSIELEDVRVSQVTPPGLDIHRPETAMANSDDEEMKNLASKLASLDNSGKKETGQKRQLASGTFAPSPLIELNYDEKTFPGIHSSHFIKDIEISYSRLMDEYVRTSTDWDEYRTNKIAKTMTDSIENTFFVSSPENQILYIQWHGNVVSGTSEIFAPTYNIVDVHEAVLETKLQEALDQVLEVINEMPKGSIDDWKKMRYVIAFTKEICKKKEHASTAGWVLTALFVFQILLNLSTPKKHYLVPYGKTYDIAMDKENIEGKKTIAYRYTAAHYVFELICVWALGFRVPAALLRPQFIFSEGQGSYIPEIYLRARTRLVDRDFISVALTNIANYVNNVRYDILL